MVTINCESKEEMKHFDSKPFLFNDAPVVVKNASKSFWQRNVENIVLNDLNLTVPKGKIYGLLGVSGCGKTTLLKCIIGSLSLDKGEVLTFGETPGTRDSSIPGPRLGYMPQEDALDGIMSVKEVLYYYGCLLCIPKKRILEKITFLVNFLKLPSEKAYFSTLSGGQKRRVSFAVALINDAELLILDEPTVGVDQILKRNIWNYLYELVQDGLKTVIITTHYIEEARSAHYVAMMSEGKILTEGTPDHLLSHYNKNCLEDVFLCVLTDQKKSYDRTTTISNYETDTTTSPLLTENNGADKATTSLDCRTSHEFTPNQSYNGTDSTRIVHWSRLRATVYRDSIQLLRYPGLMLLMVVSPILMLCIASFCFGRPVNNIQIGIVNEDMGYAADQFLSHIDNATLIQNNFSCWEDAEKAVRNGNMWAAVKFGQNFTTALYDRWYNMPVVGRDTILKSNINVSLDDTSEIYAKTIRYKLLHAYTKFIPEFLVENGMRKDFGNMPIVVDDPVFGNMSDPFVFYLIPAFIALCSTFYPTGLAVLVIFLDKDGGKLERIYTTGLTPFEIIIGCLINQLVFMIVELTFIFFTVFFILEFPNEGSTLLLFALCVLQGILGTILGVLIGASIERYITASVVCFMMVVTFLATSGLMWSIEFMESIMRHICMMLPFPLPTNAMRNIMFRSWTLLKPEVSIGFGITFIWTIVLMTFSWMFLRAKKST